MHNGYITVDKKKMSKSEGNFFTVRDILKEYEGESIRFFLLSGHYRSPIDFSRDLMNQSKAGLDRMSNAKSTLEHLISKGQDGSMTSAEKESAESIEKYRGKFIAAMDEDLNTADAISTIFELIGEVNTQIKQSATKEYAKMSLALIMELANVLGLLEKGISEETVENDSEIIALIGERDKARAEKNWARADEIRDALSAKGITIKDTPQGTQIIQS
jgi:cysteinyl-tRNA synthetase